MDFVFETISAGAPFTFFAWCMLTPLAIVIPALWIGAFVRPHSGLIASLTLLVYGLVMALLGVAAWMRGSSNAEAAARFADPSQSGAILEAGRAESLNVLLVCVGLAAVPIVGSFVGLAIAGVRRRFVESPPQK